MSLELFMKDHAILPQEVEYIASKRFRDEAGKPVAWKLRPVDSSQSEQLRSACMKKGKEKTAVVPEVDTALYISRLLVACTIYPNLHDKALQDSYGAMCAEDLLRKMLLPGEYDNYNAKVAEICGFDENMDELVNTVKNS